MVKSIRPQVATKRILVTAPQPFFQDRGTPIAVKLLVEELARLGFDVHLLVFHEGININLPGVVLHRTPDIAAIKDIPPSISWKKIVCDCLMFFKIIRLVRQYRFDLIHAVEESAFMARVIKMFFAIPYIYDMDSSIAIQLVDKLPFLRPLRPFFKMIERGAVRGSVGIVAVCRDLEDLALRYAPDMHVVRLEDISLLNSNVFADEPLREAYSITGPIMLYVGNLEKYQGIDLLLDSFQIALQGGCHANVVIIGGSQKAIASYTAKATALGIAENTHFCGPQPIAMLGHYLAQADILLSPRIQGNNTPMKLYSYLDSAKPILATKMPAHTQVLTDEFSCLVEPDKKSMAMGMVHLLNNPERAIDMGQRAKQVAEKHYSHEAFREKLTGFYKRVIANLQ